MKSYEVRLAVFEGPLDLLLHLIEKEEVDIWAVSMAEIADQYLHFLGRLRDVELESAGEYLAMAALLVRIKARHLLPHAQPDEDDEDEDEIDFEEALRQQLVEYKRYKEASAALAQLASARERLSLRPAFFDPEQVRATPGPPDGFAVQLLTEAFVTLLAQAPPPPKRPPLLRKVDLQQKVADVHGRVRAAGGRIAFEQLFTSASSRWEWIVTFLAVLELIHKAELHVRQQRLFGELELELAAGAR